jgi:LmbE family N-acetylglucosaminyl deacetylase
VKAALPGGLVAVVSPHLDDGILSLGAGIARATRRGTHVRIVTVFANDPASQEPPSEWDRAVGFGSAGEAARTRRAEDRLACERVGATPVWLPFTDADHGGEPSDEPLQPALAEALAGAELVLVPGYPLAHPDHVRVTRLLLQKPPDGARLGLYVEQPYAAWRHVGRGRREWAAPGLTVRRGLANAAEIVLRTKRGRSLQRPVLADVIAEALPIQPTWAALRAGPQDRLRKRRALRAYDSQFRGFGKKAAAVIALYEFGWGGEGVALT